MSESSVNADTPKNTNDVLNGAYQSATTEPEGQYRSATDNPSLYQVPTHGSLYRNLSNSASAYYPANGNMNSREPANELSDISSLAEKGELEPPMAKLLSDPDFQGKQFPTVEAPELFIFELAPDSPSIALNWTFWRKMKTTSIYAYASLTIAWGSSVLSPASATLAKKYHIGMTTSLLNVSLFMLGYCLGPICWAPMSEITGRKTPLYIGLFLFSVFQIAVATAQDIQTIMICRFFGGYGACVPLCVVAAAFADMYPNRYRGTAITIFAAVIFVGPLVAPIVGGFLTKSYLGWRWTEYITSFMGFLSIILIYLFCEETYLKTITENKVQEYREITGNQLVHARSEEESLSARDIIMNYLLIPLKMLATEPIVFLVSLYCSFVYAIIYLLLEAYPVIFQEGRHFPLGVSALPYIGILVGVFIGCGINCLFEPWYFRQVIKAGNKPAPEARLPPMMIGSFLFPAGIFWLAWSGYYTYVHWIVPTLSGLLTGAGILLIFLQCLNYLLDAYLFRAASVFAANVIMRSAVAGGFPLFAVQMFHNMGVGWAGSLLGFIATALIPMPFVFFFFGRKIRRMSKMAVDF